MKKSNVLLLVAVVFEVTFALIFSGIIDLYIILNEYAAESIIHFLWSGAIVAGFIAAYINYEENKTVSIVFIIISFLYLVLYTLGTFIGTM